MGNHGTKTLCENCGESDTTNCRWELQSKLMREVQGRIGEMMREQKKREKGGKKREKKREKREKKEKKGEKRDYANDYNQCSWFYGCYKEH